MIDEFLTYRQPPKVVHISEPHDVYIGRGTKWGNIFEIGKDGTRKQVIEKYRNYLLTNDELMDMLPELEGLRIGCWCKTPCQPNRSCHGDILVEFFKKYV